MTNQGNKTNDDVRSVYNDKFFGGQKRNFNNPDPGNFKNPDPGNFNNPAARQYFLSVTRQRCKWEKKMLLSKDLKNISWPECTGKCSYLI